MLGRALAGDYGQATAGCDGLAITGDYGQATAGYDGLAITGDYGQALAGEIGTALAGDEGRAVVGELGIATAGYKGQVSAGYKGILVLPWVIPGKRDRLAVGYVGEDGLLPNTLYQLNELGKFVRAEETKCFIPSTQS